MEKYLVIFLFAGHGLQLDGMQVMLYNEFNQKQSFYKLFRAEAKLRSYAEIYHNAYIIGIFACCRQTFDHTWMEGKCISKEEYEAKASSLDSEDKIFALHHKLLLHQQNEFANWQIELQNKLIKNLERLKKRQREAKEETKSEANSPPVKMIT